MTEIVEQWRPIDGYDGLYEVSNLGKVRRVDGYDSRGRKWKGKIKKLTPNDDGYYIVLLSKEGKVKKFKVHRLVAQAFITNPDNLPQINHKNEIKTDNRVDNLEWCDCKYNNNYGTRIKLAVQTGISNGKFDPEMCGVIKNEGMKKYQRMWWQKNKERLRERQREYQRERRKKKKQEKKKNNKPSETSLW